ncbi:MAG: acyl transferase, partial [Fulvivirga sp.]|nr:acyl transferase [Fulvivirga sp.]
FYLDNTDKLIDNLQNARKNNHQIILLGVSFALLELAELHALDLSGVIVMETGGMKGRRKEIIRSELHELLKNSFGVENIHSEYGMTELMSQSYAMKNGIFEPPAWMKVLTRDMNDPFDMRSKRRTGGLNIIDLANLHSCAFIETEDMGVVYENGHFEVLGRIDNSEIRGCNLLVAS